MRSIQGALETAHGSFYSVLDRIFPPDQRADVFARLQQFALTNPKLAAFLALHVTLTGIPVLLFITFSASIFFFSLITALFLGLFASILFTLFVAGIGLVVLVPIVFLSSLTASFVFFWGLGGYLVLSWLNGSQTSSTNGTEVGGKLKEWSGGRIGWVVREPGQKHEDGSTSTVQVSEANGGELVKKFNRTSNSDRSSHTNNHTTGGAEHETPPKDLISASPT